MTLLIVVDMQNDFVTGALGTAEAQAIVPHVNAKIAAADAVVYTLDTHGACARISASFRTPCCAGPSARSCPFPWMRPAARV